MEVDDDRLYTAYGDGRGFEPFVSRKLSMGLACVEGDPDQFLGTNLRAESFERLGDGKQGAKVSSLLAAKGVLYGWSEIQATRSWPGPAMLVAIGRGVRGGSKSVSAIPRF